MKIAVLIHKQYQTLEAWYPYLRLKEAGFNPLMVGTGEDEYLSKSGYPARPDAVIKGVSASGLDGVIVPGGYAPDHLRRYAEIRRLVRDLDEAGKLVAAICHGGWVLVSAGILSGRKVTGYWSIQDDLVNAGAEYVDREVVVDNNLITARHPGDLPAFCREILGFLQP
jgi:protease I